MEAAARAALTAYPLIFGVTTPFANKNKSPGRFRIRQKALGSFNAAGGVIFPSCEIMTLPLVLGLENEIL